MQTFKLKLMPGDYVSSFGITLQQYEEIGNRFIEDGCPRLEFPMVHELGGVQDQKWFGWSQKYNGFYHACSEAFDGRLLTYSEIMELAEPEASTDWHERGELPPIGYECEFIGFTDRCTENEKQAKGQIVQIACHFDAQGCKVAGFIYRLRNGEILISQARADRFSAIKTDRQKAIEKALEFFDIETTDFLGKLYDAGLLKLPEEK